MTTEFKVMDGHVFTPSLQDISLKRFRMRYCPCTDGYYLHWDKKVGPHLARIRGLENGVHNMYGVQRFYSADGEMNYLSVEESEVPQTKKQSVGSTESIEKSDQQQLEAFPPSISWKFDFQDSGLAIMSIKIKANVKQYTDELGLANPEDIDTEPVTFHIRGDKRSEVDEQIYLGDYYTDIPVLRGSRSVILTANIHQHNPGSLFFLPSSNQGFETPLDIEINLTCPKREGWPFIGEILLGMKYSTSGASESLKEKPDITVDCGVMGGQLQVHIVEGAGLVKEGTKKAFNSFVKCRFLPDQQNQSSKQTSPRHNAYPTWTKEFIFAGIDKYDLINGGIEMLLYDHHKFFSNSLIGGVRLSQPQTVNRDVSYRFSFGGTLPTLSHPLSRECSPPCNSPTTPGQLTPRPLTPRAAHLDITNLHKFSCSQPDLLSIDLNDKKPHTHFATINRPDHLSISGPSAVPSSPLLVRRVPVFTVPRSQRRDSATPTSPFGSPKFMRKNYQKTPPKMASTSVLGSVPSLMNSEEARKEEWMDSTGSEVTQWKNMLNNPGQWTYCWHIIRHKITPA